jgi:thiamine biosynthesis lipoprotein
MRLNRRRFLAISAAVGLAGPARAAPISRWQGVALGARASITLAHPEADRIIAEARAEIDRLENVFSLYRRDSALSRLNATGALEAPPLELVECLGLAGAVHAATGGAFDPTVQPLWAAYAEASAAGRALSNAAREAALARVGWQGLRVDPARIAFAHPGMALTLNGIAQGYIADRVARLLEAERLTDILIDTGEIRALGGDPRGGAWLVGIECGDEPVPLRDRAIATSAPLGTVFDAAGRIGHILEPRTGFPAAAHFRSVTVTAPSAALADALSTALCLTGPEETARARSAFPACQVLELS